MVSKAGLHEVTFSWRSSVTMATGLFRTSSAKYCSRSCVAAYSRAFSMAMAACGANMLISRRSSSPNTRAGSRSMNAMAPTRCPPISSGTTITAWKSTTSAYWRERPAQAW